MTLGGAGDKKVFGLRSSPSHPTTIFLSPHGQQCAVSVMFQHQNKMARPWPGFQQIHTPYYCY